MRDEFTGKPIKVHFAGAEQVYTHPHARKLSGSKYCLGSAYSFVAPPSFAYSKGNFSEALQIARRNGVVRFRDISGEMLHLQNVGYARANGFNSGSSQNRAKFLDFSLKDYLRFLWNNPQRGQSPGKMFSDYLEAAGLDENGDVIYRRKE